jgi:hypothetical protein
MSGQAIPLQEIAWILGEEAVPLLCFKSLSIIEQYHLLILDVNNKVGQMIAVHIAYLSGNRGEVLPISEEDGTGKDTGVGRVSARHFNDLYASMKVE